MQVPKPENLHVECKPVQGLEQGKISRNLECMLVSQSHRCYRGSKGRANSKKICKTQNVAAMASRLGTYRMHITGSS